VSKRGFKQIFIVSLRRSKRLLELLLPNGVARFLTSIVSPEGEPRHAGDLIDFGASLSQLVAFFFHCRCQVDRLRFARRSMTTQVRKHEAT
jgi:hypothetical protein